VKTRYQLHVDRWAGGCGNDICEGARRCYARGQMPCDLLFVGEAPGESEDDLGKPFVGPAGKLLDRLIDKALAGKEWVEYSGSGSFHRPVRLAFTNLVCCIPREEDGAKASEPAHEEIIQCSARLQELAAIARPHMVICVGKHAREYLSWEAKYRGKHTIRLPAPVIKVIDIIHPAAILRMNVAQKGLEMQRVCVTLATAFENLMEEMEDSHVRRS
jgi:uracil-DNA glycosylase family 4